MRGSRVAALRRSLWRYPGAPGATPLSRERHPRGWRLGADVGGTFTDLVLVAPDGRATTRKVLSTTANYAEAVVRGIRELLAAAGIGGDGTAEILNRSTLATDAKLRPPSVSHGVCNSERDD